MSAVEFEPGTRVKVIDPSHPLCGLFYDITDATEVRAGEWRYAIEGAEECSWRAEQLARVTYAADYAVDDVIRHQDNPTEFVVTGIKENGALQLKSRSSTLTFTISAYAAATYYVRCPRKEEWHARVARLARAVSAAEQAFRTAQRAVHEAELARLDAAAAYNDAVMYEKILQASS